MKPEGIFQFGKFQLDPSARTLRRADEIVTLNRRAFDVLLYLVQNPGKVLTRKELLTNVWADTFVDENSLAQSISALRRALEEKPSDNNYITTLPGRGYQFIVPVQVLAPASVALVKDAATFPATAQRADCSEAHVPNQRHHGRASKLRQGGGDRISRGWCSQALEDYGCRPFGRTAHGGRVRLIGLFHAERLTRRTTSFSPICQYHGRRELRRLAGDGADINSLPKTVF